ncbi:MAG: hypothetical protein HKN12_04220, partial [Gemmatimonadetes bacterium]|nr:hypothetical protein [Gemmatimonadota bacterium]
MRARAFLFSLTLTLALGGAASESQAGLLTVGAGGSGFRSAPNSGHFALTYHHAP